MDITVNTMYGTFIVPSNKADDLVKWLEANAVKAGQRPVAEEQNSSYTGRQLINE
jgi:hypothetical protein